MQIVMADSLGMCFGVRDAVALALSHPRRSELTVLGELVHNPEVLRRLREAGVRSVPALDAPVTTPVALVTAHGASQRAIEGLRRRGLEVIEATCPLVRHAHRSLLRLVDAGYFPVVIGRPDHVEVQGLIGDLDECAVIQTLADIPQLAGHAKIGVISQTTQPLSFVLEMVDAIRAAFPEAEVRFRDTVCQPTKDRQTAARRLAAECEVVVVVGGRNSNNTRQLLRTCEAEGAFAYQVERAADLRPEWFAGVERVGLTAGTSTPDETIESVRQELLHISRRRQPIAA
jgi:4-hydroxy-3-methylbut-2-enyl diphosphate reductase